MGRYKIDPITGIRYKKGSLIDTLNKMDNSLLKKPKYSLYPRYQIKNRKQIFYKDQKNYYKYPYFRKNYYKYPYFKNPNVNINDIVLSLSVLIVLSLILAWFFIIKPFVEWFKKNIMTLFVIFLVILIIVIIGLIFYLRYRKKREAEKRAFEEEQRAKGLVKFVDRFGNEKWGLPDEVKQWEEEDKEAKIKESRFNQVVEAIKKFQPSRRYENEFGYHIELQGWLKSYFQNAKVELQTGASRPDIVIGDIAIEVKGPTDNQALDTLTTKCLKYSNYYNHLIIVLFQPIFSESNYVEIVSGIRKYFPHVEVIRKD
ncbi:MAG: hypothetical protein QXW07_01275 [Candidatus Woesearchaeota archaeon]